MYFSFLIAQRKSSKPSFMLALSRMENCYPHTKSYEQGEVVASGDDPIEGPLWIACKKRAHHREGSNNRGDNDSQGEFCREDRAEN